MKNLFLVCLGVQTLLLVGCGGGGRSNTLRGVANISSQAERPRVVIFLVDNEGGLTQVSEARMSRSESGFSDVPFSVQLPAASLDSTYAVAVYNDRDGNEIAADSELLGFADDFLGYLASRDRWMVVNSNGLVIFDDATKLHGSNFFIQAEFNRTTSNRKIRTGSSNR